MMAKTIVITGPITTQSGYGVHGRQIAQWAIEDLEPLGWKVIFNITGWGTCPLIWQRDLLISKIHERVLPITSKPDILISIGLPNEWSNAGKINIGITAAVETTIANPEWIKFINMMNKVIVPSQHAANSLIKSGASSNRISIVPEAFIEECEIKQTPIDLNLSTEKNLLTFGQISGDRSTDRKNTYNAIKYFLEAFKDREDVGLIVKTNLGRNNNIDRINSKKKLKELVDEVRGDSKGPKIYFLHGDLKDKEVAALYQNPKILGLYSCTRGEGFGLPLLEAAACGLPVIASNWSAHVEFLPKNNFIKLNGKLINVPEEKISKNEDPNKDIFIKDSQWFEVDEDDVKNKLINFIDNPSVFNLESKNSRKDIKREYNIKKIKKMYSNLFRGII